MDNIRAYARNDLQETQELEAELERRQREYEHRGPLLSYDDSRREYRTHSCIRGEVERLLGLHGTPRYLEHHRACVTTLHYTCWLDFEHNGRRWTLQLTGHTPAELFEQVKAYLEHQA